MPISARPANDINVLGSAQSVNPFHPGLTDVERKVAELVGQARAARQGDHQLVTVDDIKMDVAGLDGLERISDKVVARALRDCGCVKFGKPALWKSGRRTAVWSIDNHAVFEAMSSRALGNILHDRVNGWEVPTT